MQTVDLSLLMRLRRKLNRLGIHSEVGDPWLPVPVEPLLGDIGHYYTPMPESLKGYLLRLPNKQPDIALNRVLWRIENSAHRRETIVHEWSHLFCGHEGEGFAYLWREGWVPPALGEPLDNIWERQCHYVSAFVLIQPKVLLEGRDEADGYIARKIDTPEFLFPYRWYIWRRFKM